MNKGFNIFVITKTIIMSLFVLFFGIIYVVFIKTDGYNPADLLETYIVDTNNNYYHISEYSGFGTYNIEDSVLKKATDNNIVSIEMYVVGEDDIDNIEKNVNNIKINSMTDNANKNEIEEDIITKIETTMNNDKSVNLININTASIDELDTLPKIGPSIANAILKYREKYGKFKNIEQIKNVTGIGDKIFESIKDLISV